MAGIEIKGLAKSYPIAGGTLSVLKGLDLFLPSGTITVVLGKSGCGKTTLLRLVGGLELPDAGTINLPGTHRTAYVFQEPRLMQWLNVRDNICFGLKRRETDPQKIAEIIRTVGLDGFEKAWPDQLSGGMAERVALARALAYEPSFIMMDEPFAALDHFTRESMQKELLRVRRATNASILFVTHSIDEALTIADKIVLIRDGVAHAQYDVRADHPRDLLTDELIALKRAVVNAMEGA
ncbi:MAG: ABC transporter ATP-binding protein [Clostridiales bacterium]|nr:ABC transporter ATP-binding protein [Clostridiales bacterium]